MSSERFQIAYDGPDVHGGSMDVYALAPALLALGDLVRDTNRFFNQDRAAVIVQVESDFQHGSFDVSVLMDQTVIESAKQVLFGEHVDSKAIFEILFGSTVKHTLESVGVIGGLLALYKYLKGKKPDKVVIYDNSTTIVNGDIRAGSRSAEAYQNDGLRSKIDGIMRPLGRPGINKLEIRKNQQVIEEVHKEDLPERVLESSSCSSQQILIDTRETLVKVVSPHFENGKWKFSDGNAKFSADIQDPVFRQKLDNGDEGFYKGDVLKVRLTSAQTAKGDGKLHTDYSIEEVLDHTHTMRQPPLLPPAKTAKN